MYEGLQVQSVVQSAGQLPMSSQAALQMSSPQTSGQSPGQLPQFSPASIQFEVLCRIHSVSVDVSNPRSLIPSTIAQKSDTVLRTNIDEMANTGLSIMPEGLEEQITKAEMADLLAYLNSLKWLQTREPGAPVQ